MRPLQKVTRLLAAGLLLSGLSFTVFAQDQEKSRDRLQKETTMTGCLNKDASGNYTLTDENTGAKTAVSGPTDLEKHSSNHKVALTGATKADASGKPVFEVTKIQHISPSCKAPSQ